MIIHFGTFNGTDLTDRIIPDSYIKMLALRKCYTEPGNRFNTTWKVPITLAIEARREMERRGYRREDDNYVREE